MFVITPRPTPPRNIGRLTAYLSCKDLTRLSQLDMAQSGDRENPSEAPKETVKQSRSRLACSECRKAKQRCLGDGPASGPCKRCQLYDLSCEYVPGEGVKSGISTSNNRYQPYSKKDASSRTAATRKSSTEAMTSPQVVQTVAVEDCLKLIAERLSNIEETLKNNSIASTGSRTIQHGVPQLHPHNSPPMINHESLKVSKAFETDPFEILNPIKTFRAAIRSLQAVRNHAADNLALNFSSDPDSDPDSNGFFETEFPHLDALHRAILSEQDAETLFKFFFTRCNPWIPLMDIQLDSDPVVVRKRSPLLFHAICAVSAYYSSAHDARCLAVYNALVRLFDELLGQTILAPKTNDFQVDFVKAVLVTILYKPIQSTPGMPLDNLCHVHSKVNDGSSFLMNGLAAFLAHRIYLNTSPNLLMRFDSSTGRMNPDTLSRCRTYYCMIISDTQASLQSGRIPNILEEEDALKSIRLFGSLNSQPSDVRLSAKLELFVIARKVAFLRLRHAVDITFLNERNLELDHWYEFWYETLQPSRREDSGNITKDTEKRQVAYLFDILYPYIRFRINSFGLKFWMDAKCAEPSMSEDGRKFLSITLKCVEELIFKLSQESKRIGVSREVLWPEPYAPSKYPVLTPDSELAEALMTAPDTYLAIILTFPLLFAGKLASKGLVTIDLEPIAIGEIPSVWGGCAPHTKLCRLMLLAADILDIASPNPDHFCKLQSKFLRQIREIIAVQAPEISEKLQLDFQADVDTLLKFFIGEPSNGTQTFEDLGSVFEDINRLMGWDVEKHTVTSIL